MRKVFIILILFFVFISSGDVYAEEAEVKDSFADRCFAYFQTIPSIKESAIDGSGLCSCLSKANVTLDSAITSDKEIRGEYLSKGTKCFDQYLSGDVAALCKEVVTMLEKSSIKKGYKAPKCECFRMVQYKNFSEFWLSLNSGVELPDLKKKKYTVDDVSYCMEKGD